MAITMRAATRLGVLGPVTTRAMNPVMVRIASRVPGLGVLKHVGRATGREYSTPLLVLRRNGRLIVGLWYGSDVHWVKNLVAAGKAELRLQGCDVRVVEPEVFADPRRSLLPLPLRLAGALVGLTEFIRLREV